MDAAHLIAEHSTWMRASGLSERNIADRDKLLRRLDRELPLGLLYTSYDELVAFQSTPRFSRQTRVTYGRHIRGFYAWAARSGYLAFDPSEGLPQPSAPRGKPRPVKADALTRILTEAQEPYRTWALLAAYGGLRAAEIAGLDSADISEAVIVIHGKGGKVRRVPMHPLIWEAVKVAPAGPLFRRRDGHRYTANNVSAYFSRYMKRLGIQASLHPGRHWCATEILRGTGNVRKVQLILGHSSLATSAIYTEVLEEELGDAISVLPDLAGTSR